MAFNNFYHIVVLFMSIFVVLIKINYMDCHPIDIIYTGHGCHCEKLLPYEVKIPVPTLAISPSIPKQHGYRVEVPPPVKKSKFEYSLDFEVEKPMPSKSILPALGKNLFARVDRIALTMPDCSHTPGESFISGFTALTTSYNAHSLHEHKTKEEYYGGPKYRVAVNYPRYLAIDFNDNNNLSATNNRIKRELLKKRREKKILSCPFLSKKSQFEQKNEAKSKITKRAVKDDIVPNENFLNEDHIKKDIRIPEVMQYMPEVTSTDFQRGKCFACQQKEQPSIPLPLPTSSCKNYVQQFYCQPTVTPINIDIPKVQYYQTQNLPNSFEGKTYDSTIYKNSSPNKQERFVYDRLGHKYTENKGNLKLVNPNNEQQKQQQKQDSSIIVGDPRKFEKTEKFKEKSTNHDAQIEYLLRDIIDNHKDFIEASDHGVGILTPSVESQRHDIRIFLRRLIGDRLSKWLEKRRTEVYEHDISSKSMSDSYEGDDSFERFQRGLQSEFDIRPVTNSEERKYLLRLIPKSTMKQEDNSIKNKNVSDQRNTNNSNNQNSSNNSNSSSSDNNSSNSSTSGTNKATQENSNQLQNIKENHLVKFRKDGKVLQLLTSPKIMEKNDKKDKFSDKLKNSIQ